MPSTAAPMFSSISAAVEAAPTPALPTSFPDMRVTLDPTGLPASRATLTVTSTAVEWGAAITVRHADIIMHAVALRDASFPPCVYAQLEPSSGYSEMRIVPDAERDLPAIFKALCAGAALAEEALAEAEGRPKPGEDGPMFSKLADGSVGAVDFDALLDDSSFADGCRRFEDAEESEEGKEGAKSGDPGADKTQGGRGC